MPSTRTETVLIVDDFEPFRRLFREKLLENGFHFHAIAEAMDGLEAVAIAGEIQPGLVLLDISMPNLNGIDAAARIRSVAPESKVLFVSQNSDPDVIEAALKDGAVGHVCKSALNSDFVPAIKAALAGKRFVRADFPRL